MSMPPSGTPLQQVETALRQDVAVYKAAWTEFMDEIDAQRLPAEPVPLQIDRPLTNDNVTVECVPGNYFDTVRAPGHYSAHEFNGLAFYAMSQGGFGVDVQLTKAARRMVTPDGRSATIHFDHAFGVLADHAASQLKDASNHLPSVLKFVTGGITRHSDLNRLPDVEQVYEVQGMDELRRYAMSCSLARTAIVRFETYYTDRTFLSRQSRSRTAKTAQVRNEILSVYGRLRDEGQMIGPEAAVSLMSIHLRKVQTGSADELDLWLAGLRADS